MNSQERYQQYLHTLLSELEDQGRSEDHQRLTGEVSALLQEQLHIYLHKSLGYGAYNTSKHGLLGIEVRLSDKIERLYHLLRGGEEVKQDTIEDQFQDIIGYALLGLLQSRGHLPQQSPR